MKLTPYQLGRIEYHLRFDNWLSNAELIAELADHYAETIAAKMEPDMSFTDALGLVTASFGGQRGLLELQKAKNGPVFRQATTYFWQVILAYKQPYRSGFIAGLFLALCGFPQLRSLLWTHYSDQVYFLFGLSFITIALFIRQSLLYVAGRSLVQPFPAIGVRLSLLFLVFSLARSAALMLKLLPNLANEPFTQALLATGCIFIWVAAIEALFVKNRFAVH
ncbi:hypothetical protein [uncultured Fibrella sp.]|uniref:hypothetical protein n=1 Tax=uncultured Fibrella sp. TaxID=1284596 RepID=UPI0035CA45E2